MNSRTVHIWVNTSNNSGKQVWLLITPPPFALPFCRTWKKLTTLRQTKYCITCYLYDIIQIKHNTAELKKPKHPRSLCHTFSKQGLKNTCEHAF